MQRKFWIIWNPTAPMPPKVHFFTKANAEGAAEALARKVPGDRFHVLELCGTVTKSDIQWTFPEGSDDAPF